MVVVDARVDHGHHDARTAGGDIPGGLGVDGGQIPLVAAGSRIVGQHVASAARGVLLEAGDVRVAGQPMFDGAQRGAGAADQDLSGQPQSVEDLEVDAAAGQKAGRLGHGADAGQRGRVELDDPIVEIRPGR